MENKMDHIEFQREIVQGYEKASLLWNPKNPYYYNKQRKILAWQKLAMQLGISVENLKKKLSSLTGSYRREKSRIKRRREFEIEAGRSGESSELYTSQWFAFKWFKFLDKEEQGYNPTGPILTDSDEDLPNADVQTTPESQPKSYDINTIRKRMIAKRHPTMQASPNDSEKLVSHSKCMEEDEFDAFGRNVALQLKQMPIIQALESQELIQRILKEQRINALQNIDQKPNVDDYEVTIEDSEEDSYPITSEEPCNSRQDPLTYSNISEPGQFDIITKSEPE